MKKVISWILLVLTMVVFAYDMYFAIAGSIDVRAKMDKLVASDAGGHAYLGVGFDVLVMIVLFGTFVGLVLSIISSVIAKNRAIKIISITLLCLFILVPVPCTWIILSL